MGLLTNPPRLDGTGEHLESRVDGQVREVVFALSAGATFADQPGLFAGHVLAAHVANALPRPVSDPYPHSREACRQSTFCAAAPTDRAPGSARKPRLCRDRPAVWDVSLPWATVAGDGKDQCHITRIDLLMPWNADSPLQTALTERVPERRTHAVAGIGQHESEAHACGSHSVDLVDGDLRFAAECLVIRRNPRPCHTIGIARPALRQEQPPPHPHGYL